MKVLHSFLLAVALCAVATIGCSGDPPTLDRLQTAEEKIQIISPDQSSILVAGRVEEVIWVTTSHKPIWSYRVFLCGDTNTNDQEMLGSAQVLPNLVLYHGILSPGLNGTYTIRVEAYGPGPNAVMLLSATSEPFTIIPSFQGEDGGGVDTIINSPNASTIWYTDGEAGNFYNGYSIYVFDSEQCPVADVQVNYYLSDGEGSWHYQPQPSSCEGWGQHGYLGGAMFIPSNLWGENYQLKVEIWTFYGMFMLASDSSEPFIIERRNTGTFSISEPDQQTVWSSGAVTISGNLLDNNGIPTTSVGIVTLYAADPTTFTNRVGGVILQPTGDEPIYGENGWVSWDVYLEYPPSPGTYVIYITFPGITLAVSEPFTIQ